MHSPQQTNAIPPRHPGNRQPRLEKDAKKVIKTVIPNVKNILVRMRGVRIPLATNKPHIQMRLIRPQKETQLPATHRVLEKYLICLFIFCIYLLLILLLSLAVRKSFIFHWIVFNM